MSDIINYIKFTSMDKEKHKPNSRTIFFVAQQPNYGLGRLIFELCRSHNITHTHTHTPARTLLNKWSARRRGRYLHNTEQTQETNIHGLSRIRTRNPSN
jgi:hypothetical protein